MHCFCFFILGFRIETEREELKPLNFPNSLGSINRRRLRMRCSFIKNIMLCRAKNEKKEEGNKLNIWKATIVKIQMNSKMDSFPRIMISINF